MKHLRIIAVIVLLAVCFGCVSLCVYADETQQTDLDTAVTHGFRSIDAASAYLGSEQKTENVDAAVVYETNSNTLMYAWNADIKMYPSSLVKMLTALIAVEQGDLQSVVTVSQDALDSVPYYAASIELQVGEQLTLDDLLYAMMVGSANDAAAVIATHIGGSINGFVNKMNEYAKQLGCTATQFTNVHGLHDENQYTTARDMARILAAAVKNENFITYFSEINHTIPKTNMAEERELSSGNFLMNTENLQLYFDERATGGRTGTTDDGKRCLATLAQNNGMELVCIVMGSESTFAEDGNTLTYGSFKETSALLDACFTGYQVSQILYEDQVLKQSQVINGENDVVLCSKESIYSVLPEGVSFTDLSFRYGDQLGQISAPVEAGQVLTSLEIWHGGYCIAQTDLIAMNSVRQADSSNDVSKDDNNSGLNKGLTIIAYLVGGVVAILVLIRLIRYVRIIVRKKRIRRYKRSRRRSR